MTCGSRLAARIAVDEYSRRMTVKSGGSTSRDESREVSAEKARDRWGLYILGRGVEEGEGGAKGGGG